MHALLRYIHCGSIFTRCVSVGPCHHFLFKALIDRRSSLGSSWAPIIPILPVTVRHANIASPWNVVGSYISHGSFVGSLYSPTLLTMDAFRTLRGCARPPMAVASDPEAQHSHSRPQSAWSTITLAFPTLNRGSVLSRHDAPPMPSMVPDDTPPAYTYPPPSTPLLISGSEPSDPSASRRTVVGCATIVAVMLTVALFATAMYLSFFNHSKV